MEQDKLIKIFIRFLKNNNAYSEYQNLWINDKGVLGYENINIWLTKVHPTQFIFSAFIWQANKWSYLHKKWIGLISKKEN